MKSKMNIKSILIMATISLFAMLFINISLAANTAKIKVETAKLRQQPSTDSIVLELASEGEDVEVLEKDGEWYKVKYKNITGYIRQDLLEIKEEVASNIVENTANDVQTENATPEQTENVVEETTTNNVENQQEQENTEKTDSIEIKKNEKYIVVKDTKLKIIPLITAIEIKEVKKDEEVVVKEILNKWANIEKSNGEKGWIILENLTIKKEEKKPTVETTPVQTKKMYVNSQSINVREKATTSSNVIAQLTINQQVTVMSNESGWYYVEVNGKKGYIAESLLSNKKQVTSRSTTTQRATTQSTNTSSTTNNTPVNQVQEDTNDWQIMRKSETKKQAELHQNKTACLQYQIAANS